jgi:hypothetical protein
MFPPPATPHAHPPACSRLPSRRRPRSYCRCYPLVLTVPRRPTKVGRCRLEDGDGFGKEVIDPSPDGTRSPPEGVRHRSSATGELA